MRNPPSTSLLTLLSLYTSLRRTGSSVSTAQDKLRGLVLQLELADRKELLKAIQDWETEQGKDVEQRNAAKDVFRSQRPTTENVLNPLHGIVSCPTCGKKNDSAETVCAYCGGWLKPTEISLPTKTMADSWFGPDSKLCLTINGVVHPVEISVRSVVTFGRHTPDDDTANVNLAEYRGDVFGVSRLHASIKYQNNSLTIVDLRSTNHTFLNDHQLKDGEALTLSNGDNIRLGNLEISVAFKHLKR